MCTIAPKVNLASALSTDIASDTSRQTIEIAPNNSSNVEALLSDNSEIASSISQKKDAFENDIEVFKLFPKNVKRNKCSQFKHCFSLVKCSLLQALTIINLHHVSLLF